MYACVRVHVCVCACTHVGMFASASVRVSMHASMDECGMQVSMRRDVGRWVGG